MKTPIGIKILAILFFLDALLALIFIPLFFLSATALGNIVGIENGEILLKVGIFIALPLLLYAGLAIYVGWGLWTQKRWARITAIVLLVIGILFIVYDLGRGAQVGNLLLDILLLMLAMVFLIYVLFDKKVKKIFHS